MRMAALLITALLLSGCGSKGETPDASAASSDPETEKTIGCRHNLLQLGMALEAFAATHRTLPHVDRGATLTATPGLSWRVHLLPYLGFQPLWDKFHHDEPWDSAHNLTLLEEMPATFKSPGVPKGKTSVHVFVGEGTTFGTDWSRRISLGDIKDGGARTIAMVLAGAETAEEWTKPGGIAFDPEKGLDLLGTAPVREGFPVAFFGEFTHPAFLPSDLATPAFNALVSPDDGAGSQAGLNHWNPAEGATEVAGKVVWSVTGNSSGNGNALIAATSEPQTFKGSVALPRSVIEPGSDRPPNLDCTLTLRIPDTFGISFHSLKGKISEDGTSVSFEGPVVGLREPGVRQASITMADYANPKEREQEDGYNYPVIVVGRFPVTVQ